MVPLGAAEPTKMAIVIVRHPCAAAVGSTPRQSEARFLSTRVAVGKNQQPRPFFFCSQDQATALSLRRRFNGKLEDCLASSPWALSIFHRRPNCPQVVQPAFRTVFGPSIVDIVFLILSKYNMPHIMSVLEAISATNPVQAPVLAHGIVARTVRVDRSY